MGMNGEGAMRFVVDLETVPIPNAEQYLDPVESIAEPDYSLIMAAKNLTDPVKIAADLEKRRQAAREAYHEQCQQQAHKRCELLERCALDLDLCRIVALGWQREDCKAPDVFTCVTEEREAGVLRLFWDDLDDRSTVGYNSLSFDLPVLMRRSLYLGVPAPRPNLNKYRTNHLDLQQVLSHEGTKPYRSLNWYCKRWGITVADDITGKDVARLVAEGNWEAVQAHCRADVLKTKALAERVGVLQRYAVPVESVL